MTKVVSRCDDNVKMIVDVIVATVVVVVRWGCFCHLASIWWTKNNSRTRPFVAGPPFHSPPSPSPQSPFPLPRAVTQAIVAVVVRCYCKILTLLCSCFKPDLLVSSDGLAEYKGSPLTTPIGHITALLKNAQISWTSAIFHLFYYRIKMNAVKANKTRKTWVLNN